MQFILVPTLIIIIINKTNSNHLQTNITTINLKIPVGTPHRVGPNLPFLN